MPTTDAALSSFIGPVDTSNYHEFQLCIVRDMAFKLKPYAPLLWTPFFYGAQLTNAQYNEVNGIVTQRLKVPNYVILIVKMNGLST